jgi:hypothetical protein
MMTCRVCLWGREGGRGQAAAFGRCCSAEATGADRLAVLRVEQARPVTAILGKGRDNAMIECTMIAPAAAVCCKDPSCLLADMASSA